MNDVYQEVLFRDNKSNHFFSFVVHGLTWNVILRYSESERKESFNRIQWIEFISMTSETHEENIVNNEWKR
jgi:hypothetical protein